MSPVTISKNSPSVLDGLNPAANATGPAHSSPRSIHHSARTPASNPAIPARCSSLGRSKTQSALAPTPTPLPPSACFFSPCHATDLCLRACIETRPPSGPRQSRSLLQQCTPSRPRFSRDDMVRIIRLLSCPVPQKEVPTCRATLYLGRNFASTHGH